jgi:alkanesulfonate monooxygenase SsuD/methylene tetrahydromethanopterin reductase-like flavin-dependent oxidoreductase (luciferase family)
MKVGVLQFFSWTRRVPLETVYARALERIAIMDEGGYDAVWLAEHHFNTYSVCPSVTLMGTHVAARTQRLRIGMAVTLAAFYHPLRLAEELALLDVLSGGRVNWGAGRGFDATEFRAFGVPPEESSDRFRECVEVVLAAWRDERVTFKGQYWDFADVEVLPKPLQQPHPPVWLAATSPDSIRRAAEGGYSILMDPHAAHEEIGRKRAAYRQLLEENGHAYEGRILPTARLLAVAPTAAEAAEVARQGAEWTVGSYARSAGEVREGRDPIQRYVEDVIIHGTPSQVTDRVRELEGTIGLDYLLCAPLSHDSFMLFTRDVLPNLVDGRRGAVTRRRR